MTFEHPTRAVLLALSIVFCACPSDPLPAGMLDAGSDMSSDMNLEDTGDVGADGVGDVGVRDVSTDTAMDMELVDVPLVDSTIDREPSPSCEIQAGALPCLPESDDVIIVRTLADVESARAGQIAQIDGLRAGGIWVPPYVTLRGCNGATVSTWLAFEGSAGAIEGFIVEGSITAHSTGTFTVRDNLFVGDPSDGQLQALANDGLVAHQVTLIAERNVFRDGNIGIRVATRYDNALRSVDITARNNLFFDVANPISIFESGLMGRVTAEFEFNTLARFVTGVSINAVETSPVALRSMLLVGGTTAIRSDSPFTAVSVMTSDVEAGGDRPISGSVVDIPNPFAVATPSEPGDFRLRGDSLAVDALSSGPDEDLSTCLRPRGDSFDVGALEY